jgi:S1-C subfamily serine protease
MRINQLVRRIKLQPLLLVAALVLSGYTGAWLESRHEQTAANNLSTQKKIVTGRSQLISQIAKTVSSSVVSVNVAITASGSDIFGMPTSQQSGAAGTGIIISKNGLIVTNRHVVPEGTTNVDITLSDGTDLKDVSVVGRTNTNDSLDVAFLKINDLKGHQLTAASLGDSSKVQVGDDVVAIGNALGQFQNTVTSGIISGFGRSVLAGNSSGTSAESLDNLFQTDAAINEGNSGGPLVNLNGQVVGINTAVAGGAQNIGFAIPIGDIKGLIDQVIKTGKFSKPYLGVRYVLLTEGIAAQFDLKTKEGAFIVPSEDPANPAVLPNSPAAKAGLKDRDVITAVDGAKIDRTHSLASRLGGHKPGDKVTLTILRDGKSQKIEVKLESLPGN